MDDFLSSIESYVPSTNKNTKRKEPITEEERLAKVRRLEESVKPYIDENDDINMSKDETIDELAKSVMNNSYTQSGDNSKSNRIIIKKLSNDTSYSHEVTIPPNVIYEPLKEPTHEPLKKYKFTLDKFQQAAILCIENKQSVLVSAHTSAGKTVIAEYVIAKALKDKQRVIYTTPIKALSNQKYREFCEEFNEVGLLTGDVTIAPHASVLIMTTEILQSMLYRGSSIMREVGWVIFDEIHFMRDRDRGVVWEESIVLMPDNIRCAFLSATIPNARQFAEWVAYLHSQVCHVVFTEYRPVPLQHYVFPCGGDGLLLVVDDKGKFLEGNFKTAMNKLGPNASTSSGDNSKADISNEVEVGTSNERAASLVVSRSHRNESNVLKIVRLIMEHKLEPLIVFSFSKKECEIYATQLAKLNFNTESETACVDEVFNNAMECLSVLDRELPQVITLLPLLRRGIGVHHGGLLPILKETVEILFGEGLLKCLFATETFAMGLNMPARTVLFTSARKYDGFEYRWISANEYIQMSGRAGRRGKDDRGTVILMIDETMNESDARKIIQGKPDPLNSAFKITYNMLLNLMRVEGIDPEFMIERSFSQFQNQAFVPQAEEKLKQLKEQYDSIIAEEDDLCQNYHRLTQSLDQYYTEEMKLIQKSSKLINFLQPGRLIKIKRDNQDFGWGALVDFKREMPNFKRNRNDSNHNHKADDESVFLLQCLLPVAVSNRAGMKRTFRAVRNSNEPFNAEIVSVRLKCVSKISAVRILMPEELIKNTTRMEVIKRIDRVKERFKSLFEELKSANPSQSVRVEELPVLDPVKDIQIKSDEFLGIREKIESYEKKLNTHALLKLDNHEELLNKYVEKDLKAKEIEKLVAEITEKRSIVQLGEMKSRKRILRRLQFCTDHDLVELKGRVACEITGADELLVTELLLKGVFNKLSASQAAALTSCLVFEEKSSEIPNLDPVLSDAFRTLQSEAKLLAEVSADCRLNIQPEEYVDSFKPHMMDIVLKWAQGQTFAQLVSKTMIFEGSIIRCIRLLEEVLRQLANAAKTIGNESLEQKFMEAIKLIKRDIVFAASLYL